MVLGWWKRRKHRTDEPNPPSAPPERRGQYRRTASNEHDVRLTVHSPSGPSYPGEYADVSVGGASALFTLAGDPGWREGDLVEVELSTPVHESLVRTPARVVYSTPGDERCWRYGFQFVNVGNLYAQLDEYYARFFNRRSSPRIPMPPERRVTVALLWGDNELACTLHDLSATGMCSALPEEKAARIAEVERLRVRFRLPGMEGELYGPAFVRHREHVLGRVLLGIEFDLDREDGLAPRADDIRRFVERRTRELERWEAAVRRSASAA